MHEPILEPLARHFRFQESLRYVPKNKSLSILDIGCGPNFPFYRFLSSRGYKVKSYTGIEPLQGILNGKNKKVKILKKRVLSKLPIESSSCNLVVSFAVLEHVDEPDKIISESIRVLKKGGVAIFTTPSKRSKKLLEFLSFQLGVISSREIKEHKQYFQKEDLLELVKPHIKKVTFHHKYFEMGMNNLLVLSVR